MPAFTVAGHHYLFQLFAAIVIIMMISHTKHLYIADASAAS